MAPRARGSSGGRARARASRTRGRAATRSQGRDDGIPSVYKEMMHEAGAGPSTAADRIDDNSRPRKRPKRAGQRPVRGASTDEEAADVQIPSSPAPPERALQTIEDDSESDLEFEDVEIGGSAGEDENEEAHMKELEEGFTVTIKAPGNNTPARARRKRRPVTSAEKQVRLAIHKMHVLYLLYHVFYRNHWCNDEVARAILKPMATSRVIGLLNPDPRASQAQSSTFFLLGLNQLCDLFHARFKITSLGMRRPQWLTEREQLANFALHEKIEKPLELADFRRAAQSLQGSADLGAQLFCCLLRAVGVEARLVCSLQPLGFASAAELAPPTAGTTPAKKTVYLHDPEETPKAATNGPSGPNASTPTPKRITRIGQPRTTALDIVSQASSSRDARSLRVERPSYPVFWVEAFNSAHQKWVAVDPMATHTVGKPSRLEPGINDPKNCMTYVIAFEEDGVARDVTRRYTKAFTAKTRKLRVEYTENGTSWLRKAMKLFRRPRVADRDALEDAELTAKAAQEGMPKNVQDFKNHPLYALGRHLRRNEIIHPKQESGRINAGTANNPKFESVYRRANVHIVKSADKWFRLGREIKMGEQPMKHAMPRRGTRVRESPLDPEVVEEVGVGLYAAFQTQVYVPPAVGDDGKIPKNQYGNIDIYVPSMIPSGAVWIRMPEAKHAAKLLRIDYADAVTGFDFKGRHGTARMDGVVVAEEFFEAMEIACGGIREGRVEEIEAERRREALRLWRKFMVGLREVERIEGYLRRDEVPSDGPEDNQGQSTEQDGNGDGGGGGGFVVEADDAPMSPPVRRTRPQRAQKVNEESAGGFPADSGDESDGGGGFLADSSDDDGDSGGGFMPEEETVTEDDIDDGEDDNQGDGGFLPDAGADEARADHDGEREEGTTGNNEVMVPDDTPFGFASIRIPELSRAMLYRDEESGATPLPHVIRGMRRREEQPEASQHVLAFDQAGAELSHVVLDKAIADFEIVSQLKDDKMVDAPTLAAEPAIQQAVDEPLPDGERPLVDATMAPLEISRPAEKKIAPPKQEKEEPPMSSYEYDDDMLDEDPEDEDAEPEWIV